MSGPQLTSPSKAKYSKPTSVPGSSTPTAKIPKSGSSIGLPTHWENVVQFSPSSEYAGTYTSPRLVSRSHASSVPSGRGSTCGSGARARPPVSERTSMRYGRVRLPGEIRSIFT